MLHEIHLGVTGLRRSGKTVFLTALIYQLTEVGSKGLDAFESRGVKLLPGRFLQPRSGKVFPYADNLVRLRESPANWPLPTDEETNCTLEFHYQAAPYKAMKGAVLKTLGWAQDAGTVRLHIHDYPGEFLLDVPMLMRTYKEWSDHTLGAMVAQDQDRSHITEYRRAMAEICQHGEATSEAAAASDLESQLQKLRLAYGSFLEAAESIGLEALPPGMTRAAKEQGQQKAWNAAVVPFVPLDPESIQATTAVWSAMEGAYQKYRQDRVAPFVERLRRSTRQLVLVDVLRVLRHGLLCYNDTWRCLAEIVEGYTYASWRRKLAAGAWAPHSRALGLTRLSGRWVNPGIDRLIFAATKADHSLVSHRDHLTQLLQDLVEKAAGATRPNVNRTARYEWFSTLRSTADVKGSQLGRPAEALRGTQKGDLQEKNWNPGIVPKVWPNPATPTDWAFGNEEFAFPEFQPPPLPLRAGQPWPNLCLDQLLWQLLGDCFNVAQ